MSTVHGRVWPRTCQDVLLTPCRVPCSARAHLDGALTDASRGIPLERRRFQLPTGSALLPLLSSSRLATFVRLLHNWWFNVTFGHGAERGVEREQVRRWKNRYRRSSDVRMVTNTPGSMLRSRSAMARKRGTSQSRLNDGWGNGAIPYAGMPGREANEEGCEAISVPFAGESGRRSSLLGRVESGVTRRAKARREVWISMQNRSTIESRCTSTLSRVIYVISEDTIGSKRYLRSQSEVQPGAVEWVDDASPLHGRGVAGAMIPVTFNPQELPMLCGSAELTESVSVNCTNRILGRYVPQGLVEPKEPCMEVLQPNIAGQKMIGQCRAGFVGWPPHP